MKPKYGKVLELKTPSDFSQCAMEAAMNRIWEEIAPEGYHLGKDYYSLEIGVEGNLLKAIDVARAWGVGFSLSRTFHPDEWQLSFIHRTSESAEHIFVWCGGA